MRMRRFAALLGGAVACAEGRVSEAPASVAERSPASAAVEPARSAGEAEAAKPAGEAEVEGPVLAIDAGDRTCASDGDCTAILTQCSMCEGACTGVRGDRAGRYEGKLDCSQYRGSVCNYDCRPRFGIEAPRCVEGRCESVRIR